MQEHDFPALIHPADLPRIRDAWAAAKDGSSSYHQEYRVVWSDGSVHWLASLGGVIGDAGTSRFLGITYDITESKEAEERHAFLMRLSDAIRSLVDAGCLASRLNPPRSMPALYLSDTNHRVHRNVSDG